MKKILLTLCTVLLTCASAWAEEEITGLKIEMKDEAKGYTQILFTDSPVLTHDTANAQIVISANGIDDVILSMGEIKSMNFLHIDETTTGIEALFPQTDANAQKGIYTLGGQKVDKVQKGQIYIINGVKVMVK